MAELNDVETDPAAPARLVSYAQNFEDVMLWRALGDVRNGTYIDIGAAWPTQDSVTALFYERGWSGINVDPNPTMHEGLVRHRPRDVNVCAAVADVAGTMAFSVVGETGLSTLDAASAERYESDGYVVHTVNTSVVTLRELWRTHIPAGREVHFLKIDVEGAEEAVIRGGDWEHHRPRILVIEATQPGTQIESFAGWQPLVEAAQYDFVYTDGLNRYYLAREHAQLAVHFRHPPNVFDEFITAAHALALHRAEVAEHQLARASSELERLHVTRRWSMVRFVPGSVRRATRVGFRALRNPRPYIVEAKRRVKVRKSVPRHLRRARLTLGGRLVRFAQRRRVCRVAVRLLDRVAPPLARRLRNVGARHSASPLPETARGYLRLLDDAT